MLNKQKAQLEPVRIIIAKPFMAIHPHILSLIGLAFSFLFFYAVINHMFGFALFAIAGSVFDMIDGTVAKMQGKTSPFGFFLDSTLDRVGDFLFISAFGFAGIVSWELVICVIMLSFLISFIRSRTELTALTIKKNVDWAKVKQDVGVIERPERILLLTLGVISLLFFPDAMLFETSIITFIFLALFFLSLITVAQRFYRAYEVLNNL